MWHKCSCCCVDELRAEPAAVLWGEELQHSFPEKLWDVQNHLTSIYSIFRFGRRVAAGSANYGR